MTTSASHAPGWPGIPARWTSSAKSGVGTALSAREPRLVHAEPRHPQRDLLSARRSRVHARPRVSSSPTARSFFSEEKRDARSSVSSCRAGRSRAIACATPALDGRYRIEKDDPDRSAARRRAAARPLRAARGRARRLPPLRAARAAPGQPRRRATRRGSATTRACRCCSRERDGLRAGAGLLGAVARAIGRLRRLLGRLAGTARPRDG